MEGPWAFLPFLPEKALEQGSKASAPGSHPLARKKGSRPGR